MKRKYGCTQTATYLFNYSDHTVMEFFAYEK
jgi:hypothetical protein